MQPVVDGHSAGAVSSQSSSRFEQPTRLSLADALQEAWAGEATAAKRPPSAEELAFTNAVRESVLVHCAWLKFTGFSYYSTPEGGMGGSTGCLMFFVCGLPWARRSKWLVPLRLAASKVLDACGFDLYINNGNLYLNDRRNNLRLKVDFSPALSSRR
jgi:hypothetical protein